MRGAEQKNECDACLFYLVGENGRKDTLPCQAIIFAVFHGVSSAMLRFLCVAFVTMAALASTPYQRLVEQMNKAAAVECRVVTSDHQQLRIIAGRGGKLRMESAERTIVSNGVHVWNYVPARKTVTISPVTATGATFDRIAFELLTEYRAAEHDNGRVLLQPMEQPRYGVRYIVLEFRGGRLHALTIAHATGTEQWQIRSLHFNPRLTPTTFEFTPPAGVETVDLR